MVEVDWQFGKISLTGRERDILRLLTNGLTDSEIADAVILTVGTVKWYNRQIYNKLGVRNRIEAITRAQRLGLLSSATQPAVPAPSLAPTHNLPAQISSFIGRNHELAELKASLLASRLVTLTGPPGTGKTRLALEVASALLEHYQNGVYFVSLASIQDANLVAHTIAQVLDVKEAGSESSFTALKATLHDKRVLLVLDNFEHLLPAAPLVSDLLAAAPRLTALVTSREVLRLYGEREFPVPPLQLPDLQKKESATVLQSYEAVELFIQRAHAAQPTFALSDDNAASVATICFQLDGLPLAIELAAARLKFYAPQTLLLRLGSRLEALGEGARDLPARQRTLRATLAWSYDLLTPEEQILFARLGVFAGGFNATDAEAVCADSLSIDVLVALESLLNKSLLRQIPGAVGEPRFMMLETMREYALVKLVERDEIERIRERHALYFLALAERASQEGYGSREAQRFDWLEIQHGNLRTALQWSLTTDVGGESSLSFVGNLADFWMTRGYLSEGRAWLTDALRLKEAGALTEARAHALRSAGTIAYMQCDYDAARVYYEEALDIDQQRGDQRGIAYSLIGLGDMETALGDYNAAEPTFQKAAQIMQQLGDGNGVALALNFLGWCVLRGRGDYPQATAWFEQTLALYQQAGHMSGIALAYSGLGEIAVRQGELKQAVHLLEQSLRLRQELGQKWGIAATLGSLAWAAQGQGDFDRAKALLGESLLIRKDIGDPGGMAWCLEKLAEIAHIHKDDGRATLIFGAAASLRASVNSTIDQTDQTEHERIIARIRARLGNDVYEAVWAEGQAMPLEHLMEYLT
jgi:predicted ATPase/DNA-binding CsgD family transcriptional regulator